MDESGLTHRLWILKWRIESKDKWVAGDVTTLVSLVFGGPNGVDWDRRTKAMLERTEDRLMKKGIRILHDQG